MVLERKQYLEDPNNSDSVLFEYYDVEDVKKAYEEFQDALNKFNSQEDLDNILFDELYRIFKDTLN